jgi:hypothetical protein
MKRRASILGCASLACSLAFWVLLALHRIPSFPKSVDLIFSYWIAIWIVGLVLALVGFAPILRTMQLSDRTGNLMLRLQKVTAIHEGIVVASDTSKINIVSPDPSQRVLVREELLDANRGRPSKLGFGIRIPNTTLEHLGLTMMPQRDR